MGKYHRYASRADALAYVAHVNGHAGLPIIGNVLGVPAPNNQQTERWCTSPIDCEDGEQAVPELSDEFFDALGIDATEKATILSTYVTGPAAVTEDFLPSWVPDEEQDFTNIIEDGTLTANSEQGANVVARIADKNPTTFWRGNADPQWVKCEFASAKTIVRFAIKARLGDSELPKAIGYPRNFILQGSNNDSDWDDLRQFTSEVFMPGEVVSFRATNQAAYKYYRLRVTLSAANANVSIAELRLLEAVV